MNFFKWINSKLTNLQVWDISLIKISTLAAGLFVAKIWPPLLSLDWQVYLAIAVVAAIKPISILFRKSA